MPEFTLDELLRATLGDAEISGKHETFLGVSIDSREVKDGEIFFALTGPNFDGHDFAHAAALKGARGIVASRAIRTSDLPCGVWVIRVDDTLKALQRLAHYNRSRFGALVVAVTGSTGKTSTKDMIYSIFARRMETTRTYQNFNNEIGVALTLLGLEKYHEACIVELAMRAPGEIRELSEIVRPDMGVITNVGESHIELLGSLDNIAKAKSELIEVLGEDGVAVLNGDCPHTAKMKDMVQGRAVLFGLEDSNEARGKDMVNLGKDGTQFTVEYGRRSFPVHVPVPGIHNVYNALAAAAVALVSGLDTRAITEGLANLELTFQRMDIQEAPSGFTLIDDTYNASPSSVNAALHVLEDIRGTKRRAIAVLGDMLELGHIAETAHRNIGKAVIERSVDVLITVGDLARLTGQEAVRLGMNRDTVFAFNEKSQAIDTLRKLVSPGDVILVKGSRSMEMEEISKTLLESIGGGPHVS
ncbi:MAG: UDP-N-acetylmuramoyl-tripeptide--D-alanyl-D-alanine ligase [Firmicutes bacterium]|jgi:UDP-N-acetylmuramoyl-tripeptide--D-alanyl-D-alanine ligase|nr:UDP-N-acetylmuramoyl-tripeptide--D-alanyl-D-alanine ligase [Bacillota bacterium]